MATDLSVGDLIQRLHALSSTKQPAPSSPSTSRHSSPAKPSSVSAFHIHPTFSPSLLSSVAARAGLPPLPPPAMSPPPSQPVRHQQSERFIQALLARHEQSLAAGSPKPPTASQSPDASAPSTPAATAGASSPSAVSSPSASSAAAGRSLLHSLIVRYTGTALPLKRSPARSVGRKSQLLASSAAAENRPPSSEQASPEAVSTPAAPSPSTPQPPLSPSASSSSTSSASSRHHRQLFTRSVSSITPATGAAAASQASTVSSRPKRSSSSAGSTARQRASVEVEKAQLKAAAEAARHAARATEMAASLLINATSKRMQEEAEKLAQPAHTAEDAQPRKRERLSGGLDTAQPGAHELLRLSSAGEQQPAGKRRDTSSVQHTKRRRTQRAEQSNGTTDTRGVGLGRKRKEHSEESSAPYSKRQAIQQTVASKSNARVEERAEAEEHSGPRDDDTSGDSADEDTDGSGVRSYYSSESEVESDNDQSHSTLPRNTADTLLATTRSSSFAMRLSSPLLAISSAIAAPAAAGSLVSSASFGVPVLSSGPLARTSSRGGRLRGSPLLN